MGSYIKRPWLLLLLVFILMSFFALPIYGEEMPEGFDELLGALPSEVTDRLEGGIFSGDSEDVGNAVANMVKIDFWLDALSSFISSSMGSALRLFLTLSALVLMSAVLGTLGSSMSGDSVQGAVRFCSCILIMSVVTLMQGELFDRVALYFERLTSLMGVMIPITGTLWAMGGNVSTATAGTSALYVFLNVCQGICAKTVLPVCSVFTALALCNAVSPEMGLGSFTNALKKIYAFFLGGVMTLLLASLTASTALNSASDGVTARAAKLVSANIIPVVGASVGDTLRTVAASVTYLKGLVGISGIVFILLLLLPVLIALILTRLAFLLASGFAELMGCTTESKFLSELGGVYAVLVAVAAMSGVMFIFALTVFSKTVVALG